MRKRRAVIWAIGAASAVFGAGAALPVWSAWYFGTWEATGSSGPLWEAVGRMPATWRAVGPYEFWDLQGTNLVLGAVLVLLAAGAGYWRYRSGTRRGHSEEAHDFAEGPAGSVPDGRGGPRAPDHRVRND
jgi:hypothetical protein